MTGKVAKQPYKAKRLTDNSASATFSSAQILTESAASYEPLDDKELDIKINSLEEAPAILQSLLERLDALNQVSSITETNKTIEFDDESIDSILAYAASLEAPDLSTVGEYKRNKSRFMNGKRLKKTNEKPKKSVIKGKRLSRNTSNVIKPAKGVKYPDPIEQIIDNKPEETVDSVLEYVHAMDNRDIFEIPIRKRHKPKSKKGQRVSHREGILGIFNKKEGKRISKAKKPNIFFKFFNQILNNKIFKTIIEIIFFLILGIALLITKGSSSKNNNEKQPVNHNNKSIVEDDPTFTMQHYYAMSVQDMLSQAPANNPLNRNQEPDLNTLSATEKVDYFMENYDLSLEDLQSLLYELNNGIEEEHKAEVDAQYSGISKVPEVKYVSTDFVAYGGDATDFLPLYNVSSEQYKVIAQVLIQAGGKLNYKEAYALMTLVLNRYISTEYPNNIYDIITEFDSYISGDYKDINIDDYPEATKAFTDCLWNFNQEPDNRFHNCLDYCTNADTNKEDYAPFNLGGNNYGKLLDENNIIYPDVASVRTYG